MTAYWAIFSARFRTLLQYRAAAMAGVVTQLFWGLIRVMIFWGFYQSSTAPQPMTYPDVVTYVWLGQATIILIFFRTAPDVDAMIRTGTVAYELVRPVGLYSMWFSRCLAMGVAPLLLRMIPIYVLASLFFGLRAPASTACFGLFLISTLTAVLLAAAFSAMMTVFMLWTVSSLGINRLLSTAFYFLSGAVIPIPLFPDWAKPALYFLPFRGLADTPFRIYMGHIPPEQAWGAILHQLGWAVAAALFGWLLLCRGTKRIVVYGG